MIKFIDINEQKREAESFIIITDNGEPFVQATIKGRNNRVWLEFYPLAEFQERNPEVVLFTGEIN